ncbi:hypothetical protein FSP39_007653 [Pinctada imbricata]|uniref:Uncharacterized protein n=1 Tax=Pinctada imbricata TaxID=66713 RepID=A0AA88Y2M5_PINIB|nr:hypothetical protein FSP39_007653 [Pinctada imbricata]
MGTNSLVYMAFTTLYGILELTMSQSTDHHGYCVILDAGSTSTKLRIYQWPLRRTSVSFLNISEVYYQKFSPGLDHVIKDMETLPDYIKPMITNATCRVPFSKLQETPIYLLATAGLRLLAEEKAIHLMTSIRDYLADNSKNPFMYLSRSVRILSGEEEGVFAWISANYHLGVFNSEQAAGRSIGVLEMGGGSTQITFHPDGPILANMFSVRVAGQIFDLYSHSYLYFGQTYMKRRIINSLINETSKEITNPCWLRDNVGVVTTTAKRSVIVRGSGDPEKCLSIINSFLQSARASMCYPKPCTIGSVYQPSVGKDIFYAIAAFTYAPKSLKAVDSTRKLDLEKLNETAFQYCRQTLGQVSKQYSVEQKYASDYCMMALYIPTLLTSAYGFPSNTSNIVITDSVNGHRVDWSLGAVIYETEIREEDYPCRPLSVAAGRQDQLFIVCIMLTFVLLICPDDLLPVILSS